MMMMVVVVILIQEVPELRTPAGPAPEPPAQSYLLVGRGAI